MAGTFLQAVADLVLPQWGSVDQMGQLFTPTTRAKNIEIHSALGECYSVARGKPNVAMKHRTARKICTFLQTATLTCSST